MDLSSQHFHIPLHCSNVSTLTVFSIPCWKTGLPSSLCQSKVKTWSSVDWIFILLSVIIYKSLHSLADLHVPTFSFNIIWRALIIFIKNGFIYFLFFCSNGISCTPLSLLLPVQLASLFKISESTWNTRLDQYWCVTSIYRCRLQPRRMWRYLLLDSLPRKGNCVLE